VIQVYRGRKINVLTRLQLKILTPLNILMQEKNQANSNANSEHKHSEIERFSMLKE